MQQENHCFHFQFNQLQSSVLLTPVRLQHCRSNVPAMTWLVLISGRDPEMDSFTPDGAIIHFLVSNEDEILAESSKKSHFFLETVSQLQNEIIQTYMNFQTCY